MSAFSESDAVSTYFEDTTTIVNGTALNSTDSLDADDENYYAVDSCTRTGTPQISQATTNRNFTSNAPEWNWTLITGTNVTGS